MNDLAVVVGNRAACRYLGFSRATFLRHKHEPAAPAPRVQTKWARKLTEVERQMILDTLHHERFADRSVREVYATILDEGSYIGSISTMYRVLRGAQESQERRRLASHPARVKPELAASAPREVWCWDITKLSGPAKWVQYHLYLTLDVFSRFAVAWRVEYRESGKLAREMFEAAFEREGIDPSGLIMHADGGPAMTSKTVAQLFSDLNVIQSRSRPRCSNDNPFVEAANKTIKYGPHFPERFANIQEARTWCRTFFEWYNNQHRHTGIALLSPADVHFGRVEETRAARRDVLRKAFEAHPERFVRGTPEPPALAPVVYINEPEPVPDAATIAA